MSKDLFFKQVEIERQYLKQYCSKEKFGQFHFLIGYFVSGYRSIGEWQNELLPYLESIQNRTGVINDWNSFPWKGIVCFRYEYLMILDESIQQSGRKFPGLYDQNGNQILNDEYEWLLDTEFIKNNYQEYVIISIDDFIQICKKWIEILIAASETST